jgi:transposase-like protein
METTTPFPPRRVIRRHSAETRKQLIETFKAGGATRKAFCDEHGIHPTTFSGWLKRERQAVSGFAEVNLPVSQAAPIEVELPNGALIKVRTTGDLGRTAELIRRVTGVQSC